MRTVLKITLNVDVSSIFQIGFFMEPTVFTDVEDHMYLAKEESFGPIMVISKFPNGYVPQAPFDKF